MFKLKTSTAVIALMALNATTAFSQDVKSFDIEIKAQKLTAALMELSDITQIQLIYTPELLAGIDTAGASGRLNRVSVLETLLANTNLMLERVDESTFVIRSASERQGAYQNISYGENYQENLAVIEDDEKQDEIEELEEVIVTGTNIRGIENSASPVFVFDMEDIRQTGAATTQDFIRTLPQNLDFSESSAGGFAGPSTGLGGASAGVNIRGLGAGATLTLVNGRRLASGGAEGDFVDISLIPLSAIERVEVLTDGASAIYGADAVAGVVNIILRDDYDGAETRLQLGSLKQFQASQTVGKTWTGGNILASYEYFRRNNLDANDRSFSEGAADPTDLLPNQDRHSVLLSGRQRLTERLEIFGAGNFSSSSSNISSNDFFTASTETANAKSYGGNFGAELALSKDWNVEIVGGYNRNETESSRLAANVSILDLGSTFDIWTVDLIADGSLFALPGGNARLAIGGQFRAEDFSRTSDSPLAGMETVALDRNVYALFGELVLPVVGENNRRPGIYALDLTAAGRFEEFSDFGSSTNPKVGIRYAPFEGLNLRGTYGTSFQAPGFFDLGRAGNFVALPGFFFVPSPDATGPNPDVLALAGGNPILQPETARNWTAGIDYDPFFAPGLEFTLTYFDINFKDRIGIPGPGVDQIFLTPDAFGDSLTLNPDASVVADFFGSSFFINPFGVLPGNIGAIADTRLQNLASTDVRGIDIGVHYAAETSIGTLSFDFNGSYLFDFTNQASAAAEPIETLNTVFNPVDWRFRSSVGWSRQGYNAVVFVNYVDSYIGTATGVEVPVASWTTVDLNLSYDTSFDFANSLLNDTRISLNVQNLFNEAPPFVDLGFGLGLNFDGANANALGRFVSLNITKAW